MIAAARLFILTAVIAAAAWAQAADPKPADPNEPPAPRAAPLSIVSEETLPRAGGVIIFGATRGAGLEAAKELVRRGEKVTAMARASADTSALKALGVTVVTGDALVADDLKRAFTTAPFRVAVSSLGGRDGDWRVDAAGNHNVIVAAKAAGIPRMVLVSAIGAGDSALARPWYLRPFQKDFIAAKSRAESDLRASGLQYTIVRVGWLLNRPPGKAILSDNHMLFSWIGRVDVGRLLADCVKDESGNKVLTAFDPSRATLFSLLF